MKTFAVLSIAICSACASAGTPVLATHATPPQLTLSTDPVAERSFPERVTEPRLPTADRQRLAGRYTAGVRVCVGPDGAVQSLDVARPSGSAAFDHALAADVAQWKYEPYAAPAGLRVCEQLTIAYVAD